jgi:NitT/TauT family transport system permease protein
VLRWYFAHERSILGLVSFAGFFVLWELGAALGKVNLLFFSSPSRILVTALDDLQRPRFWRDAQQSLIELVIGYVVAAVLGIVVGLLAGWYPRLNYFLDPWLSFLYALPRIALMPLVVLWVGLTIWSVVVAVFLGVFFTVIINTLQGVRTVDHRLLDVAASFRAGRARVFRTVVLPSTVPFIIGGLRLGVGHALVGVFIGELYASNAGIGFMILLAGQREDTDRLLFGVAVFTLVGVALIECLCVLEQRFQKWRPPVMAG